MQPNKTKKRIVKEREGVCNHFKQQCMRCPFGGQCPRQEELESDKNPFKIHIQNRKGEINNV
jgi:hypothetical protein